MNNLKTQGKLIQNGAETEATTLNKFGLEMTSEVADFARFQKMEDTFSNPSALWTIINNHLSNVIADCNSVLNPALELQARIVDRLETL